MSKGGSGTQNTVAEPWAGERPYLVGGNVQGVTQNKKGNWVDQGSETYQPGVYELAGYLYGNGSMAPSYYTNGSNSTIKGIANSAAPTVAKQSSYTTDSYGIVNKRATAGDDAYGSVKNAANGMVGITNGTNLKNNTGINQLNAYAKQDMNAGNQALSYLNGLNSGNTLKGNTGYNGLVNAGNGAMAGNSQAMGTLSAMTQAVNPYSQTLLGDAIRNQGATLDSTYSSSGRYGSGAHEAAKADAATNLSNQFYSNAYDQQMQAANNLSQAYNTTLGNQINAYNEASGAYLNNLNANIQAAQAAGNMYNTGWGNQIAAANDSAQAYNTATQSQIGAAEQARQLADMPYNDAAKLSEVGASKEAYNQALIDADLDKYNYNSQRDLLALQNLNNLVTGSGYASTSTSSKSGYSPVALGTGAAATLGGALMSMYGS